MLIWNSITCKYVKQNEIHEMNTRHHKCRSQISLIRCLELNPVFNGSCISGATKSFIKKFNSIAHSDQLHCTKKKKKTNFAYLKFF